MNKKAYEFGFQNELNKIAEEEMGMPKPKEIEKGIKLVAKHPVSFAGHVLGGDIAGMGIGAIGGALVSSPFAAALALKNKKLPGGFAKQFGKNMVYGLRSEAVGGGVAGSLMGGNKFFNKYKNEKK